MFSAVTELRTISALATCSPVLAGALVVITVFLTALVFTARTCVSVVSEEGDEQGHRRFLTEFRQ